MSLKDKEIDHDVGFLHRWSNNKIAARKNDDSDINKAIESDEHTELTKVSDSNEKDEVEYKTDADMPPIESLNEESDFSDFLSPKVSDMLRKQALRKLFHMPFLNIVDGLDDYAEDYTKFASLGDIIPHEMQRMLDREKAKELEEKQHSEIKAEADETLHTADNLQSEDDVDLDCLENEEIDDELMGELVETELYQEEEPSPS
jgi:Protein of unknown function (DUF3306)